MSHEYEAKFIDIDIAEMRKKLETNGYTCTKPETLMRRVGFDTTPKTPNKWARVRDEGDKITMTVKEMTDRESIEGTIESEVVIDNYEEGVKFLEMCGLKRKAYQETRREIWQKNDIEVMIDTWPGLNTFIEVEGSTPEAVTKACEEMNFDMADAVYGAVGSFYKEILNIPYDVINSMSVITFKDPPTYYEEKEA